MGQVGWSLSFNTKGGCRHRRKLLNLSTAHSREFFFLHFGSRHEFHQYRNEEIVVCITFCFSPKHRCYLIGDRFCRGELFVYIGGISSFGCVVILKCKPVCICVLPHLFYKSFDYLAYIFKSFDRIAKIIILN